MASRITQKKCIINTALVLLLGVVVFYEVSALLIWALWHNLTWQCSNRENSLLFTAKKIPRTSKGTLKNPWTKRLPSPNSDMPTLHNWNALNIQTTAKQVCCTLSAWNYANSKRAWYYNGNLQIVSNTQKIPAQMRAREKILSKFSYPRKSQTGKFQTLRSLDLPRHLKSGWAQRSPRPHFTAKGLDTAHLCINMQPQDCSQHDWVSLLR